MKNYLKYLELAQKPIKKIFPFQLRIDSYRVDGCGDAIDENGDFLNNNYYTEYYNVLNEQQLNDIFCGCNPNGHYRFIQL